MFLDGSNCWKGHFFRWIFSQIPLLTVFIWKQEPWKVLNKNKPECLESELFGIWIICFFHTRTCTRMFFKYPLYFSSLRFSKCFLMTGWNCQSLWERWSCMPQCFDRREIFPGKISKFVLCWLYCSQVLYKFVGIWWKLMLKLYFLLVTF